MAARGVHFAITDGQRAGLEEITGDAERVDFVQEHIEKLWEEDYLLETDKAWDGIHVASPTGRWAFASSHPVDRKEGARALSRSMARIRTSFVFYAERSCLGMRDPTSSASSSRRR
jgi:hypothetical protein